MALTTTSTLPAPLQATFNMRLLPWKQPNLIMKLAADYYRMPANGGTTLRLRRYSKLVPPVVPLGNTGVTGPSQNLSAVDRIYVHIKSFLMDLKFRPHNGEDNKAQATIWWAA